MLTSFRALVTPHSQHRFTCLSPALAWILSTGYVKLPGATKATAWSTVFLTKLWKCGHLVQTLLVAGKRHPSQLLWAQKGNLFIRTQRYFSEPKVRKCSHWCLEPGVREPTDQGSDSLSCSVCLPLPPCTSCPLTCIPPQAYYTPSIFIYFLSVSLKDSWITAKRMSSFYWGSCMPPPLINHTHMTLGKWLNLSVTQFPTL